jgi:hypothetical protein
MHGVAGFSAATKERHVIKRVSKQQSFYFCNCQIVLTLLWQPLWDLILKYPFAAFGSFDRRCQFLCLKFC